MHSMREKTFRFASPADFDQFMTRILAEHLKRTEVPASMGNPLITEVLKASPHDLLMKKFGQKVSDYLQFGKNVQGKLSLYAPANDLAYPFFVEDEYVRNLSAFLPKDCVYERVEQRVGEQIIARYHGKSLQAIVQHLLAFPKHVSLESPVFAYLMDKEGDLLQRIKSGEKWFDPALMTLGHAVGQYLREGYKALEVPKSILDLVQPLRNLYGLLGEEAGVYVKDSLSGLYYDTNPYQATRFLPQTYQPDAVDREIMDLLKLQIEDSFYHGLRKADQSNQFSLNQHKRILQVTPYLVKRTIQDALDQAFQGHGQGSMRTLAINKESVIEALNDLLIRHMHVMYRFIKNPHKAQIYKEMERSRALSSYNPYFPYPIPSPLFLDMEDIFF